MRRNNDMIMEREVLFAETERRKYGDVLKDFVQSRAYNCLFDFETGVWCEGPAYLECLFRQEINREEA